VGEDRTPPKRRTTVAEAAEVLGISAEAVRGRIRRGTLPVEREGGTVYVLLEDRTTTDQPRTTGDEPTDRTDLLIAELQDRVRSLEEANRENRRIIAALTQRIPEIEAPREAAQERREAPTEATEQPGRVEPQPSVEAPQEGTERPQQRSGWLAPVDKLPWWHYALGVFLVFLAAYLAAPLEDALEETLPRGTPPPILFAMLFAVPWVLPGILGFWVGFRQRNLRLGLQIIPFGALIGVVGALGPGLYGVVWEQFLELDTVIVIVGLISLPAGLLYVSGALIGNAWQRRRIGRISGTTPASPVSRTTPSTGQQPRKDLTPAQQAILGWGGTIISALITLVGTIITVRSGP